MPTSPIKVCAPTTTTPSTDFALPVDDLAAKTHETDPEPDEIPRRRQHDQKDKREKQPIRRS